MQIGQTRYDAAAPFGAGVLAGGTSTDSSRQGDEPGFRPINSISTNLAGSGSFDPEAIDLLQAALDEAWASLSPLRRAYTSRSDVAREVLELAVRGERDRARLCAFAVASAESAVGWAGSGGSASQYRS
jgi:hypothetical protein